MRFPHGPGFGPFGHIFESVIAGLFFLICFAVVVGLLILLVRFLLVATKAAELYVAKNGASTTTATPTAATSTPVTTTPVATSTVTTTPVSTTAVTKPTPRTRTPRPPSAN